QNTYRGLVKIMKGAEGARNYSQCDSMLIGDKCGAHTFPYIDVRNSTAIMEHEASTSKIGEDQIFYLRQRGLSAEDAVSMIVNGFCKEVFKELPMEFAVEATRLLGISLEGGVGWRREKLYSKSKGFASPSPATRCSRGWISRSRTEVQGDRLGRFDDEPPGERGVLRRRKEAQ